MGYRSFIKYLSDIGLENQTTYDYTDKSLNISNEIQRFINRSIQMFEWHKLPDTIPQEQLELMLQTQGYAIIGQIEGKLYACYGGLGGVLDEYHRPTQATISIPYLNFNATWNIGVDCVVIKNDLMTQGLLPLYAKYITLQNETEITLLLSLVNKRVQTLISASDTQTIESAKKYLDDLMNGKQGVIADNAFLESLKTSQISNKLELNDIIDTLHYLRGQLFNEIGLATNYNLKKERITQAEVELNTDNLYPLIDDFYNQRLKGIEECYNLFGVDWECEFNSSWDYRIYNGESITTKGSETDVNMVDDFSDDNNSSNTDNDNNIQDVVRISNIQTENPINNGDDISNNSVDNIDNRDIANNTNEDVNDDKEDKNNG